MIYVDRLRISRLVFSHGVVAILGRTLPPAAYHTVGLLPPTSFSQRKAEGINLSGLGL